ncbi:hypothetical protein NC651_003546 [Populus alba x Populus x berolinensis]|nr:hypothetical protein NC651_003546 [Populus alba x Populus x berolinensis]
MKEAYIIRSWGLPCQSLTRMPNEKKNRQKHLASTFVPVNH